MKDQIENSKYDLTKELERLRRRRKITIIKMAQYFGVNRDSARDWELGLSDPVPARRSQFIEYLWTMLDLRSEGELKLVEVWKHVMEQAWNWEPFNENELSGLLYPVKKQTASPTPDSVHNFSLGPIEVPVVILDGDGGSIYAPENIITLFEPDKLVLPSEILRIKEKIAVEEEAKKLAKKPYRWNGNIYYLYRWTRGRTPKFENLELRLWFGVSEYFDFLATNMSLYTEYITDPSTGERISLYDKYFADYDWTDPNIQPLIPFSHNFGVVVSLVTGDRKIIITKRPPDIGARAGVFNIPINESAHPDFDTSDDSRAPDLYKTTTRGAKEELKLTIERKDIEFFAFGVDSVYTMWNIYGVVRTSDTSSEVLRRRRQGTKDGWEIQSIYAVDFTIPAILDFINWSIPPDKRDVKVVDTIWSPGAIACIYFTLVREYGITRVDRAIKAYFG